MSNKEKEMELLSAYIDGELGEEEKLKVSSFLTRSPQARKSLERLKHTKKLMMQMAPVNAPVDFLDQLERQAVQVIQHREEAAIFWRWSNLWAWASPALAAAAVAAIVVGLRGPTAIPFDTLAAVHATYQTSPGIQQKVMAASHCASLLKEI